jgi:uncharacterized repeat protein (TIGR03803 family)
MGDDDSFSVMPFNSHVLLDQEPQPLKGYRPAAEKIVSSLIANGGTSLYDTLSLAYLHVLQQEQEDPSRIAANDGETPMAGLIQAPDGNLYGTTLAQAGTSGLRGTIFRLTSGGAVTIIASFETY